MTDEDNYVELVKQAQLGDKKSMNRLAEWARKRLQMYVYRLTLDGDLTQDILQESMLEMFRFLDKLEKADRFWPWLRRIATNKIKHHYGQKQRRRTISMPELGYKGMQKSNQDGVADLVSQELKQVVSTAMQSLKPRHRRILVLRCYEEMKYSEIAEEMRCSEFGARRLFYRAKRALAIQLSRRGLGKGSLLIALVLFGKMTATSEAAAASVSITAATTKVGLAAGLAGVMTSKATIVSLTTAGVLAVGTIGTIVATSGTESSVPLSREKPVESIGTQVQAVTASKGNEEYWYYYPSNTTEVVMMKLMKADSDGKHFHCQRLQDEQANYYFDRRKNTIYINNCRMWHSNLAVQRLPADRANLRQFLSRVEGEDEPLQYIQRGRDKDGLLVTVKRDGRDNHLQTIHRYDVLDEEFFRYDWPKGVKVVDNRNAMHKRGWTYFRISGQINGKEVTAVGRIPFVYAASRLHWPWLKLQVGERKFMDNGHGRFFKGLSRPWVGLHTIDTVRRDAAEKQVWFETTHSPGSNQAKVILTCEQTKLVYSIDLEKDVIDKIDFLSNSGQVLGELKFSYLQDVDNAGKEFAEPRRKSYRDPQGPQRGIGMLWLVRLAGGGF